MLHLLNRRSIGGGRSIAPALFLKTAKIGRIPQIFNLHSSPTTVTRTRRFNIWSAAVSPG